ncbi:MAG: transcriptional regulator [Planctomycetaceae bacterium]|nr:transcriptional regulator [Planctomycetaceae bacterium]
MPPKKKPASKKTKEASSSEGRFSYEGLDRVMHEKARLGILASLAANADGLLFNDLKQLCALTDGNLSRHLTVLTESELVEVWKETTTSRPQTLYRLTPAGRKRFAEYISVLEKVVSDAQVDVKASKGLKDLPGGWAPA